MANLTNLLNQLQSLADDYMLCRSDNADEVITLANHIYKEYGEGCDASKLDDDTNRLIVSLSRADKCEDKEETIEDISGCIAAFFG